MAEHANWSSLRPDENDYFVLNRNIPVFSTTLETLLRHLGSRWLIITGTAGKYCVLFIANDAYMRDHELIIPSDCPISNTTRENREALALMEKYLKADTRTSAQIRFPKRRVTRP